MQQIEVKYHLINFRFNPKNEWIVKIDCDPIEKKIDNNSFYHKIENLNVKISNKIDKEFNKKVDIIALKNNNEIWIIEVEGEKKSQLSTKLYSMLGQILLCMNKKRENVYFAIAVPDSERWKRQIDRIPTYIINKLKLRIFLVSNSGVRNYTIEKACNFDDGKKNISLWGLGKGSTISDSDVKRNREEMLRMLEEKW